MTEFKEAFQDLVKDMYSAEKQVLKALPKAAKACTSTELSASIEAHIKQTEVQAQRLEQIAEKGGFKPTGKVCAAAKGIIEEMSEALEENDKGEVLDAILTCGCQKFEHYEIANYGTAIAWATLLGEKEAVTLLKSTLQEEEETNGKLSELAEGGINTAALNSGEGEDTKPTKPKKTAAATK